MADLSAANSRVLSTRLPDHLYKHLVVQARLRDVSMAEALRQALERDVDQQQALQGDVRMAYRTLLGADMGDLDRAIDTALEDDASA